MFFSLYSRPFTPSKVVLSSSYTRLTPVDSVYNGSISRSSEMKSFDFSESISKFNSHDFDVSNIIACGALNMLKPVVMGVGSDMNLCDEFENHLENVSETQAP